ncbi:L-2-hydroxyglutarate oxidase [Rhizobium sp. NFR03]|uniref:L-2-hydroxyglutarate oxidase n=1 Tax=Rhizobium sp. NFR03 TaxID=1566263 RepID=UPI0008BF7E45|nr:L-2-hydroxyglutarate oxidase [Rhizobium sp. NFR03]SES41954.1 L-2-hydroxyglutarate oxidase [Rhizobium sp. NFR03]
MLDIIIIGGGIVGIATAFRLQAAYPGMGIAVVEKEDRLAAHQTGRNSGVIHAGIYYAPGSMKAEFSRRGLTETIAFCKAHGLPFEQCGKLLVATSPEEMTRMDALHRRAAENGLHLPRLDATALREREPNISGIGAILSASTGIADYTAIVRKMAELFVAGGGTIHTSSPVGDIQEEASCVSVSLIDGRTLKARHLIVCGGLQADRLAEMCGVGGDFSIVPFKGEYYRLAARHDDVVKHLIYPIPDPTLPFLGIHLTRMIGGYVTVGPNAVLSMAREKYGKLGMDIRDMKAMVAFPGFWRTCFGHMRSGIDETANSAFRSRYLKACRKYLPTLELEDLTPHPSGIRAQAVMRDGSMVHDFLIRTTSRTIHVCNAPSPAATSAIPIADYITALAAETFALAPRGLGQNAEEIADVAGRI